MKYIKYIYLFFLLLLISCTTLQNKEDIAEVDNLFRLVLKVDKEIYELGEPVVVKKYFQNHSQENLWLQTPYIEGVNLLKKVNGSTKKDRYYSTSRKRKKLSIDAGTEVLYQITSFDKSYFRSKGKWTLQIAEKFSKADGGWGGVISSNVIEITIN